MEESTKLRMCGPKPALTPASGVERLRRSLAPQALGVVARRYRDFAAAGAPSRKPCPAAIAASGVARCHGYETTETTPLPARKPADGTRPAGFTQLAFFSRLPAQAREDFLRIWLESHTAVAIETQSTFFYQQNPVLRPLDPAAPAFDAIVEETFPDAAMDSWEVYFDAVGAPERLAANQARMSESCVRFIDFTTIKLLITSEYRFGGWQDLP